MPCDIIDFRCVFMNEIVGNPTLSVILFAILFFIVAAKMKFGFDTTMFMLIPIVVMGSLMFTGFTTVFVVSIVIVVLLVARIFVRMIGNR